MYIKISNKRNISAGGYHNSTAALEVENLDIVAYNLQHCQADKYIHRVLVQISAKTVVVGIDRYREEVGGLR